MPGIPDKLEEAWLRRLSIEWGVVNTQRLAQKLRPPVFALHSSTEKLGRWDHLTRTLSISAEHVREHPWEAVVETLKHEMAHQWVSEVMAIPDSQPHGDLFAQACELIGVLPSASVRTDDLSRKETDKVLSKIKKLLALADSTDVHEAALAMATANTLLLRHNLDMSAAINRPDYTVRRLGIPTRNIPVLNKLIGAILTEFFFVEGLWVHSYSATDNMDGRVFEVMGVSTNVELAHYVYDFLLRECESLWSAAKPSVTTNRTKAKREFMIGVLLGFQKRLRTERYVNAEKGLVWIKDSMLRTFFHQRYPKTRSMNSGAVHLSKALEDGKLAGEKLTLRRGVHQGPSGSIPKLLSS